MGQSLVATMATRYHMDPAMFARTLRATVMPSKHTEEQFAAFLMVADRYGLNPLLREIYAYPGRSGGINPVVSVDGFINLVNSHPQCDGFDFSYDRDKDGRLVSCTCRMYRRDRSHPIAVTEFYAETYRNTEPWNQMPARMLRHKAFKEAARLAFGFAGIADEDEDEARDISMAPPSLRHADPIDPSTGTAQADGSPVVDALDQFAADSEPNENDAATAPAIHTGPGGGARDGGSEGTPLATAAAAPDPMDSAPRQILTREDAIDRLMALATDPATAEQEKLESLDVLRPVYDDQLKPELVGAIFPVVARVMRGELAPAAAKKFLGQLKDG